MDKTFSVKKMVENIFIFLIQHNISKLFWKMNCKKINNLVHL